ncbi:pilus assembly protein [Novosphingobium sp.]|uniref:pilus assembly protein n=1 Tax=Novosphingobium sp. TaxID=1874826 RepID=UPI0025E1F35D|nr:TadE/TadG family type IV pilus assembly protein [Novosphingobium sp.]
MPHHLPSQIADRASPGVLARLAQDQSGNTLALIAASVFPLLVMIGGGVDMGRTYLTQTRLQQACDSGVLAARKKLGSGVPASMPADTEAAGNKFFNLNFGIGAFGTVNRNFAMTLQSDMAISALASVDVRTTIMQVFGFKSVAVKVSCTARLNFTNTDIMMVLDTTGSMADTNSGDPAPKIDILRQTVKSFYDQLEKSKPSGTRIRYGFLPYSTNVNVGGLLRSDWMVDSWTYQTRKSAPMGSGSLTWSETYVSGLREDLPKSLGTSCPANTAVYTTISGGYNSDGTGAGRQRIDGIEYNCTTASDGKVTINGVKFTAYVRDWKVTSDNTAWLYQPIKFDVTWTKGAGSAPLKIGASSSIPADGEPLNVQPLWSDFQGCVEERDTYEIDDYSKVDFTKALDLDLDLVPTAADDRTRWRPMVAGWVFDRGMWWDGSGSWIVNPVKERWDYLMPYWAGLSVCPAPARKLDTISSATLDSYLKSLTPDGSTYHDIGMIWGGRMISPTGLFATENADVGGVPTNRNVIFLTDGQTSPLDYSYSTYGVEPLDRRRWDPASPKGGLSLKQVVEKRFAVACAEVKKKNVTIWVISFGVTLNPVMQDCAGPGHAFEAKNASALSDTFSKIAQQMGDLRISK